MTIDEPTMMLVLGMASLTASASCTTAARITRSRTSESSDWRSNSGVSSSFRSTFGLRVRIVSTSVRRCCCHSARVISRPSTDATATASSLDCR